MKVLKNQIGADHDTVVVVAARYYMGPSINDITFFSTF